MRMAAGLVPSPSDPIVGNRLERILHGHDFAALVVAALGADAVRKLGFMALRARRERLRLEEVVSPARARTGLGVASFGIRHRSAPGWLVIALSSCQGSECSAPRPDNPPTNSLSS